MPPERSCLDLLDPTRRSVLIALRRLDAAEVEELAAHAFLSVGAARQHLQWLEAQGFVAHEPVRHGPGRPRHRYYVTPAGEALFPRLDAEALADLLDAVAQEPPDVQDRLLRRIERATIERYRPTFERHGRESPLAGAVAAFEEAGYFPEAESRAGGIAITLHHCPIAEAARRGTLVCEAERRCLAAAFEGITVERTEFRPAGAPRCTYLLVPGDG